jgi:uncharacterized protein (DUF1330 family)
MAAALSAAAPAKPKTVIHIINVKWKADAKPEDIDKAIKAVETMDYKGLKSVWTRPIKKQMQEGFSTVIVMEFESEAALQSYAGSPAQKKFYESYQAVRDESRTHDILEPVLRAVISHCFIAVVHLPLAGQHQFSAE